MRKGKLYISFLLGLCLCLFTAFFTACKKETPPPTLENISVSGETEVFIDEFDYADYTITATYSDDSTKTATLTADNLSAEDNAKLSTVGTHALTVSYESVTCSWTVTLKNHDFAGLTFDDVTTTYDGTAKTLAVAGLPTGAQVSYDKATTYTNAGEYTVKATITLANYNPVELTATLTIKKAVYDMSAVVFEDKTVTYDGQAHSIEATNLPNGVTAQYTGNNQINADEYEITATFTGDSQNYELIASKTATLTIEQRELTLAFSGETTLKYNGSAQKTITVQATNLVGGDSVELTVSYNGEMIEAGEYIATATLTAHQNYKLTANNTVKVTITRATHTVTFKQNGVADVTREVLDLADLTDIPTPQHVDGYKFTWNRTDFTSITEDITVTANKELITYKIEYVVYDGVNSASNPTTYTVESATFTLKNPTPSETFGKSFGGWFTSPDFSLDSKITKIEKGSFGDLKLYAHWLEYRVTEVFGGTVDYSQSTPEITIKVDYGTENLAVKDLISVSDGCTWNLYNGFECLPTQELITKRLSVSNIGDNIFYILVYHPDSDEYYSDYVLNVYQLDMKTCTFIKDGETWASGEIQEESAVNASENPEKDGYTFNGWKVNGEFVSFPYTVLTDTIFIAGGFMPITYIVSYELNGGENDKNNPETYNIEQAYTLKNPTRTGYDFKGWFTEKTFDNQVTEIALGSYGNKKFYAKWTPTLYAIEYELNGGENNENNPETYNIEQAYTLKNPTRTGYDFNGWFKEETLDNQVTEIALGSYGDKKFYAKWTANLNTLKFDGNGATHGEMLAMEIATDDKQALTNNGFAKSYYHFIGWATEANGEVVYADGAEYTMGTDGEYTLYAVWKYGTSGLEYTRSSNGEYYTVTKYSGTEFHLAIPETYEGKSVTSIADSAFYGCYRLESIVLPDTITMIGEQAFYGCYRLTSIEIPNSVTSIGESAFYGCSSLESVVLSNGLTTISKKLFYECISLISIDIPEGVKTIEEAAFYKCSNLENAVISNSITTIERYTFEYCSALTNVTIGYGVKLIKEDAFLYCESLTNLYYSGTVGNWCDIEFGSYWANPMGSARNLYINNVIVKELTIPDDVTNIAAYTFVNCITLEKVIISNSVTTIGDGAFYECSSLKNVYIPNSVTEIGESAFIRCSNLTDIILPNSIRKIGRFAFAECSGLRKIEIPDSVTLIDSGAFSGCSNLTEIKLSAGLTAISEGMLQNCSSLKNIDIPSLVTSIGGDAFKECSALTNITIPNRVTYIGNSAFEGCSGLTNIVIPDNVKEMGTFIFSKCSNLEKVKFSSNMTKIPMNTFYLCYKLTTIIIPKNVVEVHGGAFDGCGLKTVYYEGTKENWNTINILGNYNKPLTNATRYYYSENIPALNANGTAYDGNYWHYDESGEIVVWVYVKPEE